MNENQAKEIARALFRITPILYLSTVNEQNTPEIRAVMNLRDPDKYPGLVRYYNENADSFVIHISTNTSSTKVRQIQKNPNAAVYFSSVERMQGVMLSGKIGIIDSPEIKRQFWQENWTMYYPKGPDDDDYTILQLQPEFLKTYFRLETCSIRL